MGDKNSLCKWKRAEITEDLKRLKKIVKKPNFVCTKCGRAARKDEFLCKPVEI